MTIFWKTFCFEIKILFLKQDRNTTKCFENKIFFQQQQPVTNFFPPTIIN